jgi:hypothetical protein
MYIKNSLRACYTSTPIDDWSRRITNGSYQSAGIGRHMNPAGKPGATDGDEYVHTLQVA